MNKIQAITKLTDIANVWCGDTITRLDIQWNFVSETYSAVVWNEDQDGRHSFKIEFDEDGGVKITKFLPLYERVDEN